MKKIDEKLEIKKHERRAIGAWRSKDIETFYVWLYVAGNYNTVEMACREAAFPSGMCVTIEDVKYIFGGGSEDGCRIGIIQYPPFPEEKEVLIDKLVNLGKDIIEKNFQFSFTIVTPTTTTFYSRVEK